MQGGGGGSSSGGGGGAATVIARNSYAEGVVSGLREATAAAASARAAKRAARVRRWAARVVYLEARLNDPAGLLAGCACGSVGAGCGGGDKAEVKTDVKTEAYESGGDESPSDSSDDSDGGDWDGWLRDADSFGRGGGQGGGGGGESDSDDDVPLGQVLGARLATRKAELERRVASLWVKMEAFNRSSAASSQLVVHTAALEKEVLEATAPGGIKVRAGRRYGARSGFEHRAFAKGKADAKQIDPERRAIK